MQPFFNFSTMLMIIGKTYATILSSFYHVDDKRRDSGASYFLLCMKEVQSWLNSMQFYSLEFNLLLFSFSVSLKAKEPIDGLDLRPHKNTLLQTHTASDLKKALL